MKTEQITIERFELIDGLAYGEVRIGFNTLKSSTFNHTIAKGYFIVHLDGVEPSELARMAGPTLRIHGQKTREVSREAMDKLNGGTFTLAELDELIGVGGDRTGTKVKVVMDLFKSRNMTKEQATEIVNDPVKWAKVQAMLADVEF